VPTPDDHGKASPRARVGRVLQEPLRAGEERGSDGDGKGTGPTYEAARPCFIPFKKRLCFTCSACISSSLGN
jgi:hypothetical protein